MNQPWFCEGCHTGHTLRISKKADVYTVINKLRDDHAKWSPDCDAGFQRMRVRFPGCTDTEWNVVTNGPDCTFSVKLVPNGSS